MPRVQSTHMQLYDSPLDSQLWLLQDANGSPLAYGGAMHDAAPLKLKKGSYTIRLLLRHPDAALLTQLKDLPLLLRFPLDKPLSCPVYAGRGEATVHGHGGAKPMEELWLKRGAQRDLYVAKPSEGLPSWLAPGDALRGCLKLDASEEAATRLPLIYEVPPHPTKPPADVDDEKDASNGGAEQTSAAADSPAAEGIPDKDAGAVEEDEKALRKALLAAKLERLAALRKSNATIVRYEALAKPLLEEDPKHLPLLTECLAFSRVATPPAEAASSEEARSEWRGRVVGEAAARITAAVDPQALAQYYGVAHDEADGGKEAKELAKDMGEKRKALRSALLWSAATLVPSGGAAASVGQRQPTSGTVAVVEQEPTPFVLAVREMKKWVEGPDALTDDEEKDALARTESAYEAVSGRPGAALATLRSRLAVQLATSSASKDMTRELAMLCRALALDHWADLMEDEIHMRFPVAKTLL